MTFSIHSKYSKGDIVFTKNKRQVTIEDIKFRTIFDHYYNIFYLVEFDDKVRKWIDEQDLMGE